jgi:hypothetical protein
MAMGYPAPAEDAGDGDLGSPRSPGSASLPGSLQAGISIPGASPFTSGFTPRSPTSPLVVHSRAELGHVMFVDGDVELDDDAQLVAEAGADDDGGGDGTLLDRKQARLRSDGTAAADGDADNSDDDDYEDRQQRNERRREFMARHAPVVEWIENLPLLPHAAAAARGEQIPRLKRGADLQQAKPQPDKTRRGARRSSSMDPAAEDVRTWGIFGGVENDPLRRLGLREEKRPKKQRQRSSAIDEAALARRGMGAAQLYLAAAGIAPLRPASPTTAPASAAASLVASASAPSSSSAPHVAVVMSSEQFAPEGPLADDTARLDAPFAEHNCGMMRLLLRQLGVEVVEVTGGIDTIRSVLMQAKELAGDDGRVLVYYAGRAVAVPSRAPHLIAGSLNQPPWTVARLASAASTMAFPGVVIADITTADGSSGVIQCAAEPSIDFAVNLGAGQRGALTYYLAKALEGGVRVPALSVIAAFVEQRLQRRVLPTLDLPRPAALFTRELSDRLCPRALLAFESEDEIRELSAVRRRLPLVCTVDALVNVRWRSNPIGLLSRLAARGRDGVFRVSESRGGTLVVDSALRFQWSQLATTGVIHIALAADAAPPTRGAAALLKRHLTEHLAATLRRRNAPEAVAEAVLDSLEQAAAQWCADDNVLLLTLARRPPTMVYVLHADKKATAPEVGAGGAEEAEEAPEDVADAESVPPGDEGDAQEEATGGKAENDAAADEAEEEAEEEADEADDEGAAPAADGPQDLGVFLLTAANAASPDIAKKRSRVIRRESASPAPEAEPDGGAEPVGGATPELASAASTASSAPAGQWVSAFVYGRSSHLDEFVWELLAHHVNAAGVVESAAERLLRGCAVRERTASRFVGSQHHYNRLVKHARLGTLNIRSCCGYDVVGLRGVRDHVDYPDEAAAVIQAKVKQRLAARFVGPRMELAKHLVNRYNKMLSVLRDNAAKFLERTREPYDYETWMAMQEDETAYRRRVIRREHEERDDFALRQLDMWDDGEAKMRRHIHLDEGGERLVLQYAETLQLLWRDVLAAAEADVAASQALVHERRGRNKVVAAEFGARAHMRAARVTEAQLATDAAQRRQDTVNAHQATA